MLHSYTFEVTDSDGFDSTQDIRALDIKKARRMAFSWHGTVQHGSEPDSWPFMWAELVFSTDPQHKIN